MGASYTREGTEPSGRAVRFALLAAVAMAASLSGPAEAQRARNRIGAPAATACAQAAGAGRFDDASLLRCDEALADDELTRENHTALLINRGAMHMRRKDAAKALADFDAVIELNPKYAEAYVNRGGALVMMGRPGPAVAALTEAMGLGVKEPHKAYFNRGAAREALGDLRGAYEDYEAALSIKPQWGPAEQELARFVKAKRDELAIRLAEAAPVEDAFEGDAAGPDPDDGEPQ